jgi:hypothetical protein
VESRLARVGDLLFSARGAPVVAIFFIVFTATKLPVWLLESHATNADWLRLAFIIGLVGLEQCLAPAAYPRSFLFLVRSLGTILSGFFVLRGFPIEALPSPPHGAIAMHYLIIAPKLAIAAAIIGWWRPAAYLYPVAAEAWHRDEIVRLTGVIFGNGEEMTLQEITIFLLVGGIAVQALWRACSRANDHERAKDAADTLVLFACACHLANYFFSAVEKMRLDGGMTDWLFNNETFNLMSSADLFGMLLFGNVDSVREFAYSMWERWTVALNFATVAAQMCALLALASIPTMRAVLILYDFWHASVALLTGIAFYLWVALNVSFTVALGFVRKRITFGLFLFLAAGLLSASLGFRVFWAGWYDSRGVNLIKIIAEYKNGSEARVPPTVYDFYSYYFYSDAILDYRWRQGNVLPVYFFGTTYYSKINKQVRNCQLPSPSGATRTAGISPFNQPALDMIRRFHPVLIKRMSQWRVYPHHFTQDPSAFKAFYSRDPHDIQAYRVVLEVTCKIPNGHGFDRRVLRTESVRLPVAPSLTR